VRLALALEPPSRTRTPRRVAADSVSPARVEAYRKSLDPAQLSGLTVVDIREPALLLAHPEEYGRAALSVVRADEITERVVLLSLHWTDYSVGFRLIRYGSAWKVDAQNSAMASTAASGAARRTTPQAFEQLVAGTH
jgi:hypothetical protein